MGEVPKYLTGAKERIQKEKEQLAAFLQIQHQQVCCIYLTVSRLFPLPIYLYIFPAPRGPAPPPSQCGMLLAKIRIKAPLRIVLCAVLLKKV